MLRRITLASLALAGLLLAACGADSDEPGTSASPTPATATQSRTPLAVATEPPEPPKELRVAFINLFSPLSLDADNPQADLTFDDRLDIVIKELKAFNPDIVGFNEASVTKAHGAVAAKLARELKMEPQYARANPWFPGQSKDQSDDLAKQLGFEEGELLLSRYPILRAERRALNPRTSEAGEGRAALHAVIKGPGDVGEIDVFITHLTGGGDKVRRAQAADFATFIANTRGKGPTIVMAGGSDPNAGSTYDFYSVIGLHEVAGDAPVVTCCRDRVAGEQPPLKARTDYLMSARWAPTSWALFGDKPQKRADGTWLYASDHNGIEAVFPVPLPSVAEP
jgi:endonuclease/exonuclease/phosphatase family metal-dependent hydrolase